MNILFAAYVAPYLNFSRKQKKIFFSKNVSIFYNFLFFLAQFSFNFMNFYFIFNLDIFR